MAQVNSANVLAVRNELRFQAEQMQRALHRASWDCRVEPCGQDPVSLDAAKTFDAKIQRIIEAHTAHLNEITEAADRLYEAARQYGYTEESIRASLDSMRPALAARIDAFRG